MGAVGATWERPGNGNWILASNAFYVVGSARQGGMGAPETVLFQPGARRGLLPCRRRPRTGARRYDR
ncbi:nitrous oxide reductase accessory protein NosL [Pararhizobium capsulatum]|uniref:nitrous oxide reductase accessory protein NosL n=1 Tax=Pararhizobium capsulatum TaxID=34014 RepID=UPI00352234F9